MLRRGGCGRTPPPASAAFTPPAGLLRRLRNRRQRPHIRPRQRRQIIAHVRLQRRTARLGGTKIHLPCHQDRCDLGAPIPRGGCGRTPPPTSANPASGPNRPVAPRSTSDVPPRSVFRPRCSGPPRGGCGRTPPPASATLTHKRRPAHPQRLAAPEPGRGSTRRETSRVGSPPRSSSRIAR